MLSDFRDLIIIIWGVVSILLLVALSLAVLILVLSVKRLMQDVSRLLDVNVKPVIASAQESVDNVAGTTRFVGDRVVAPIIRVGGIISAVRRGVEVFAGLRGRRRHTEEEP